MLKFKQVILYWFESETQIFLLVDVTINVKNILRHFFPIFYMGFSDHLQLNLDISKTDISNKMNMWKWFVSPIKTLIFLCFLPSISQILRYLEVFKQSNLVWDNKDWLYMVADQSTCMYIYLQIFYTQAKLLSIGYISLMQYAFYMK